MNEQSTVYTAFVPHGINSKHFRPIGETDSDYSEYLEFKKVFTDSNASDFIVFWNNRNVRRKQPGDVILAFKEFTRLVKASNPRAKVTLLMHTQVRDENGTDLSAVKEVLAPECSIIFSDQNVSTKHLNFLYNLADVTLNIASNEGFGLSGAESLMTGTPIVSNVTGGLQDQCRFEDKDGKWLTFDRTVTTNHTGVSKVCGEWAIPVFPAVRSLQGSIPTPYIFDDRCRYEDVAAALFAWYNTPVEKREAAGAAGREWMLSDESGMSSEVMCNRFIQHIDHLLTVWTRPRSFTLTKVDLKPRNSKQTIGIMPTIAN